MNEIDSLRREVAENERETNARIEQLVRSVVAQNKAWLLLLRHLSVQGFVNLETVQRDLEMAADVQEDSQMQDEYACLAGAVQGLRAACPPSGETR